MNHIRLHIPSIVKNYWQKIVTVVKPAGFVRRFCDRIVLPALHLFPVVQEDRHYFYIYRFACTSPFNGRPILPEIPNICRQSPLEQYWLGKCRFEQLVPNWETLFEHMLANHLFFEGFPFQERPVEPEKEFIGLCGLYALLRFLCLEWLGEHGTQEALVDVCAAAFRLIDHTAATLLMELGCYCHQDLDDLIKL